MRVSHAQKRENTTSNTHQYICNICINNRQISSLITLQFIFFGLCTALFRAPPLSLSLSLPSFTNIHFWLCILFTIYLIHMSFSFFNSYYYYFISNSVGAYFLLLFFCQCNVDKTMLLLLLDCIKIEHGLLPTLIEMKKGLMEMGASELCTYSSCSSIMV